MGGFGFKNPRWGGAKMSVESQAGTASGKTPKPRTIHMEGEGGFLKKEKLSKPYNKM